MSIPDLPPVLLLPFKSKRSVQTGFTMLELLVTITILGVMVGIAAPRFAATMRNLEMTNLANEFILSVGYARSQAIAMNRCVSLCISNDPHADSPVCSSSDNWNNGWIVFANPKCDNNPSDATAQLLQIYVGQPDGAVLIGTSNDRNLRFDSRGMTSLSAAGSLKLLPAGSSSTATASRIICINSAGRAVVANTGSSVCS